MSLEMARKVADTVLYEGYMLYPYRPSAIKNRQRWSFGIVYPPDYAEVLSATERCTMHSECLMETSSATALRIQLRFLHLVSRRVAKYVAAQPRERRFVAVASLLVDDLRIESWEEAVERSVEFEVPMLPDSPQLLRFRFPGGSTTELLRDQAGNLVGSLSRTQREIAGTVSVFAEAIQAGVAKLTIEITNTSEFISVSGAVSCTAIDALNVAATLDPPALNPRGRNDALLRSLLSAHSILTLEGGTFFSLLDPPEELRRASGGCRNTGNFPVLVGAPPERNMLLCSPIILYDYPQIAPESASDFCDATEMDEMLTLRVSTLTDDEKNEMRAADDLARNLLQRTEESAREQLARTHGTIRGMRLVNGDEP